MTGGHRSMNENEKEIRENEPDTDEKKTEAFDEIKEIVIEELAVDGVCGIY
jgi:mycofactocin precursor